MFENAIIIMFTKLETLKILMDRVKS